MFVAFVVGRGEFEGAENDVVGLGGRGKGTGEDGGGDEGSSSSEVAQRPEGVRSGRAEGDEDGSGRRGRGRRDGVTSVDLLVLFCNFFLWLFLLGSGTGRSPVSSPLVVRVDTGALGILLGRPVGCAGVLLDRVVGRRRSRRTLAEEGTDRSEEAEDERLVRPDVAILVGNSSTCSSQFDQQRPIKRGMSNIPT